MECSCQLVIVVYPIDKCVMYLIIKAAMETLWQKSVYVAYTIIYRLAVYIFSFTIAVWAFITKYGLCSYSKLRNGWLYSKCITDALAIILCDGSENANQYTYEHNINLNDLHWSFDIYCWVVLFWSLYIVQCVAVSLSQWQYNCIGKTTGTADCNNIID